MKHINTNELPTLVVNNIIPRYIIVQQLLWEEGLRNPLLLMFKYVYVIHENKFKEKNWALPYSMNI